MADSSVADSVSHAAGHLGDTMSVQLVLCVADSVWHAAGHLASVCCMPKAHSRIAPAPMLLLLAAVLSLHCHQSQLRHCRDRSW